MSTSTQQPGSTLPSEAILDLRFIPFQQAIQQPTLLEFGVTISPFGDALWGFTAAGLCHASLHDACIDPRKTLQDRWPGYQFQANSQKAEAILTAVLHPTTQPIVAWASGTAFQMQVWQALLQIRAGELISYQQLAEQIGKPKAARAVGNALGKNPLAWLVPCHRVVHQSGKLGHYHWGRKRKAAMIQAEQTDKAISK
jgi:AraC family transcriptional regulator of adaptative response/methylated-DNA-[protein]-cysteine methyltransferase